MMGTWIVRFATLATLATLVGSTASCGKDDCLAACEKGRELCGTDVSACPASCDDDKSRAEQLGCTAQFDAVVACVADSNNLVCVNGAWGSPDCESQASSLKQCAEAASKGATGAGGGASTTSAGGGAG